MTGELEVLRGELEVLRTGPLSLFQDLGRPGYAAIGVGPSGAADRASFLTANRLLGNADTAAAIECVLGGLSLRAVTDVVVAVTGAPATLTADGDPVEYAVPVHLPAGQVLKLGTPRVGLRTYVAVRGGFDVAPVLGSRSTDTLSGIGPPPLSRGARLGVGSFRAEPENATRQAVSRPAAVGRALLLRATAGPRAEWFEAPTDLTIGEWVVSPQSNRVGLRLDRPGDAAPNQAPGLRRRDSRELPSEGLVLGSVQIPPSGQPVVFLADHPVTGGYPVIAVVRAADVDRAAQARPGQRLSFRFEPAAR